MYYLFFYMCNSLKIKQDIIRAEVPGKYNFFTKTMLCVNYLS